MANYFRNIMRIRGEEWDIRGLLTDLTAPKNNHVLFESPSLDVREDYMNKLRNQFPNNIVKIRREDIVYKSIRTLVSISFNEGEIDFTNIIREDLDAIMDGSIIYVNREEIGSKVYPSNIELIEETYSGNEGYIVLEFDSIEAPTFPLSKTISRIYDVEVSHLYNEESMYVAGRRNYSDGEEEYKFQVSLEDGEESYDNFVAMEGL